MRLILLGPPGAGKGTQAKMLSQTLSLPHISTGDILRDGLKTDPSLGQRVKQFIHSGELVPDDIVIKIVMDRLEAEDAQKGFILDGFPRTKIQAESLEKELQELNLCIDLVVYLKTSEATSVRRLGGRRTCSQCRFNFHLIKMPPRKPEVCDFCGSALYQREDDKEETVKRRLQVYLKETAELIDYYHHKGILRTVSGNQEAKQVFKVLMKLFEKERLIS